MFVGLSALLFLIVLVLGALLGSSFQLLSEQKNQLDFFYENVKVLDDSIKIYRDQLKSVSELQLFYEEPTIKNLIEHSDELNQYLGRFEEMYNDIAEQKDIKEDIFKLDAEEEETDSSP